MSSEPAFESAVCDFCGSVETQPLFEGSDRLLALPGCFRVVRCAHCGLLRQDPRPTQATIAYYYPSEYEPYSVAIDAEPSRLRRWDRRYGMRKRQRAIERHCPGGRLLDVGCATGNFLHEMARTGHWQVEGVEPNIEAARYGREHLGLTIHAGELTSAELPAAAYDVITMWNVLEHLHAPMANLRTVAQLLKPGGWFVFSIPNLASWEQRLLGKYWMGWELPRHLLYPSAEQMTTQLNKLGLALVDWQCLVGAYPSFLLSLRFWVEGVMGHSRWTRAFLRLSGSLPARMVTAPAFALLTRLNRASLITGFARVETQ